MFSLKLVETVSFLHVAPEEFSFCTVHLAISPEETFALQMCMGYFLLLMCCLWDLFLLQISLEICWILLWWTLFKVMFLPPSCAFSRSVRPVKKTYYTVRYSCFEPVIWLLNRKMLGPGCFFLIRCFFFFFVVYFLFAKMQIRFMNQHEAIHFCWQLAFFKWVTTQWVDTAVCELKFIGTHWVGLTLRNITLSFSQQVHFCFRKLPIYQHFCKKSHFLKTQEMGWIRSADNAPNLHPANGVPVIQPKKSA